MKDPAPVFNKLTFLSTQYYSTTRRKEYHGPWLPMQYKYDVHSDRAYVYGLSAKHFYRKKKSLSLATRILNTLARIS